MTEGVEEIKKPGEMSGSNGETERDGFLSDSFLFLSHKKSKSGQAETKEKLERKKGREEFNHRNFPK